MRSLPYLNLSFLALLGIVAGLFFISSQKSVTSVVAVTATTLKTKELPKNPFRQDESSYLVIGEGLLKLKKGMPQLQLPDLRTTFAYFGKNVRPDLAFENHERGCFAVAIKSNNESRTLQGGQKYYLLYQGGHYHFSSEPTPLYIEVKGKDEEVELTATLFGAENTLVTTPKEFHHFKLPCGEIRSPMPFTGEIGGTRVDTALLMRQHAKWVGKDLFLHVHGGDEFAYTTTRERIDFVINETHVSCFVKEGDFLIWKEGRWMTPERGERTTHYPLLAVKKIDDNAIHFELWDVEGKGRLPLTVFKAKMHEPVPEAATEFKFIAAKTWAQFIIECRGRRMILKPDDWLVLTKEGWMKLATPAEIDSFVSHKLQGPLFVVDKMIKKEGQQVVSGHMFNASRTDMKEVELTLNLIHEHKTKKIEEKDDENS